MKIPSRIKSAESLFEAEQLMPVLFIGHGTPMNAIEDNNFTRSLIKLGSELPRPKAILCISAHWATRGTFVNVSAKPKMIYDMYGFPNELYEVIYPANGSPKAAREVQESITSISVVSDTKWGFDHGNWSVMTHLFPKADIPLFQMSIDYYKPMAYHYELARQLKSLRTKGILIIGSGNISHNIQSVDQSNINAKALDWALEFDTAIKKLLDNQNHKGLINYEHIGASAQLAVPEPSHYFPLIYAVALQNKYEKITYFYSKIYYGTLAMRSFKIG